MLLRRLAGLLTAAFMLHLNAVTVDAACSAHGAGAVVGASHHGAGMHEHAAAAANHELGAGVHEPCQSPTQAHCCQTHASCSAPGLSSAVQQANGWTAGCLQTSRASETLVSHLVALDPPPPKA